MGKQAGKTVFLGLKVQWDGDPGVQSGAVVNSKQELFSAGALHGLPGLDCRLNLMCRHEHGITAAVHLNSQEVTLHLCHIAVARMHLVNDQETA